MSAFETRWQELAEVKRALAARDWFMGTSGNLAIKVSDEPLEFLVTASGKDKYKETAEDFLLVDKNGQPAQDSALKPSAETLLHQAVYSETSAGCSLHVHTVANNVISELYGDEGVIEFQGQELIKAFGLWEQDAKLSIPIIPNHADIPKLADEFRSFVTADKGAVLIRNHGITVWGKDAFEAKKLLEASEFLFQYQLALRQFQS
ncbi:methylthioribulose 1-phosphate dehydratase [Planococcus sp. SSTMD024]|uniref:methylthioribulose 1-phosphate dehydratase n=1 Tax=Planococcus sp. SSTMD024 TaxID=3242163 RepID=UPI00351EEB42